MPIDGVLDMVDELSRSFRLGIVSNTNDSQMVPRLIDEHFSSGFFDHVLLSVDHGFRTPHPSIYESALDRFGVDSTNAVLVGDSYEADYQGPVSAGMRAFLIDPEATHAIPEADRITSVTDLAGRL